MSYPEIYLKSGARYPYDHRGGRTARKPKDWAETAARGVLANLCDRRSIKWALQDEEITLDTRREIVASLAEIIRVAAEQDGTKGGGADAP